MTVFEFLGTTYSTNEIIDFARRCKSWSLPLYAACGSAIHSGMMSVTYEIGFLEFVKHDWEPSEQRRMEERSKTTVRRMRRWQS